MNGLKLFEQSIKQLKEARAENAAEVKIAHDMGELEFAKWYQEFYLVPSWFEQDHSNDDKEMETGYNLDPAFPDHWAHSMFEQNREEALDL